MTSLREATCSEKADCPVTAAGGRCCLRDRSEIKLLYAESTLFLQQHVVRSRWRLYVKRRAVRKRDRGDARL